MLDFGDNTQLVREPLALHAPETITAEVTALCAIASPSEQPIIVPVRPLAGGVVSGCYSNVKRAVAALGGEPVDGWAIWQCGRLFIEAEHHCVLRLNDELIDISPHADGETEILFLPMPDSRHDPDIEAPILNIRLPLSNDKAVTRFVEGIDRKSQWEAAHRVGQEIHASPEAWNMQQLMAAELKNDVINWLRARTGRNDPCICGRPVKFKKCHG